MCLPKAKFVELCEEFPASAKILKYKAYLRRKQFRKAKLEMQLKNQKKLSPKKTWKLDLCKVDSTPQESQEQNQQEEKHKEKQEEEIPKQSPEMKILDELNINNEEKDAQDSQVDGNQFLEHAKRLKVYLFKLECK